MRRFIISLIFSVVAMHVVAQSIAPNLDVEFDDGEILISWRLNSYHVDTIHTGVGNETNNSHINKDQNHSKQAYVASDFVFDYEIVNTLNYPINITLCDVAGRLIVSKKLYPGESLDIEKYRSQVLVLQVTSNSEIILTTKLLTR